MKNAIYLIGLLALIFLISFLFQEDSMKDITIYTGYYPIEYITERLYGENSKVLSIYPDGVDIDNYKLNNKLLKDYSKSNLFVFVGLSNEKDYAVSMLNTNKNLKIIDGSLGMEYFSQIEEIWLNPSNMLMIAQNIRNGFKEYIDNPYLIKEIDENYEELKVELSEIDADFKLMIEAASNRNIVVTSDLYNFFDKYDLQVTSLEENDELTEKTVSTVISMIKSGSIKYIYSTGPLNETTNQIVSETGVEVLYLHSLANISEAERNDNQNYFTFIRENMDLFKKQLYN